jgi:hypothetical protein
MGCFLSLHKFGDWRPVGSTACEVGRSCKKCGKVQIRRLESEHQWIYAHPNHPCDLARHCKNCGFRPQSYPEHQYGPQQYVAPNRCDTTITCMKCGLEKTADVKHIYGPAMRTASNRCLMTIACTRCGHVKSEPDHDWQYTGRTEEYRTMSDGWANAPIYQCKVCGETKTEYRVY